MFVHSVSRGGAIITVGKTATNGGTRWLRTSPDAIRANWK
jgi:hypothetical protein